MIQNARHNESIWAKIYSWEMLHSWYIKQNTRGTSDAWIIIINWQNLFSVIYVPTIKTLKLDYIRSGWICSSFCRVERQTCSVLIAPSICEGICLARIPAPLVLWYIYSSVSSYDLPVNHTTQYTTWEYIICEYRTRSLRLLILVLAIYIAWGKGCNVRTWRR